MRPGQRIRLIREIAKNLAEYEERSEIDLILRQFNLRTWDEWGGSKKDYVVSMVEQGDDDQLNELNTFLLEEKEEQNSGVQPIITLTKSIEQCWENGILHIFISHSSLNKEDVISLKDALATYKIAAFVAHEDIQPTEVWQEEILCGLDTCHALIAWSTAEFEKSAWAQQEVGIAIAKNKIIISARRGIDPIGFIAKEQGVPAYNRPIDKIVLDIVNIFIQKSRTRPLAQKAILQSFENSWSYIDARIKIGLLEKFEDWTEEQLLKLKNCISVNRQVRESGGVPERIEAILKKFESQSPKESNQQPVESYEDVVIPDDLPF